MSYVTYEARRSLAPGHVAAIVYTLPLVLTRADRQTTDDVKRSRSLSGRTEVLYYGSIVTWDVEIAPVRYALVPLYREFLASTADGQTFQFNPDSDYEGDEINVIRDDDGYSDQRAIQSTRGTSLDRFSYTFRLREV
jgi:hypothetical protein